jgi:hypothetical protein
MEQPVRARMRAEIDIQRNTGMVPVACLPVIVRILADGLFLGKALNATAAL